MKLFVSLLIVSIPLTTVVLGQGSGNTIKFNGLNKAIDLGDEVANNCRTIEMWFRPDINIDSYTPVVTLIARDFNSGDKSSVNEFALCFFPRTWSGGNKGGKLGFIRRINSVKYEIYSDRNMWKANHWYHVAVTIEKEGGMKMYINGVLQKSSDPSTAPIGIQSGNITDRISIGKWGNLDIRYFSGQIDEVRIWEDERPQIEIRQKMCSMLKGDEPGLRGYYKFDEDSDEYLKDYSGNSYDGVLLNVSSMDRVFSGAPIGDTSVFLYDKDGLSGKTLSLRHEAGDEIVVSDINSTAKGVHIYNVASLPNSSGNITFPATDNYYGVFLTDIAGTFSVAYNYSDYSCYSCDKIHSRNDNAVLNWTKLVGFQNSCNFNLSDQSTTGDSYRAEFIIENDQTIITFDIGQDTTLCFNKAFMLDATVPNATNYKWQDGSTDPIYFATSPGLYHVTVETECGPLYDSIYLQQMEEGHIFIPNVITPNNDGYNDYFMIKGTDSSISLAIYNRWGLKVYESTQYNQNWAGGNLPSGVYYYLLSTGCSTREYKGWISILKDRDIAK